MSYVELYKLDNNGDQHMAAKFSLLDNGEIIAEGDEILIENINSEGILDYSNPDKPKLYPKDGLKFLEQLQFNFSSGYLNASEIKSG